MVEVFREPTQEEQQAHGQWLVSRRVTVEGLGVGTVVAFNKKLRGSSSHEIAFEPGSDSAQGTNSPLLSSAIGIVAAAGRC